jgi:hypothetical protein
VLGLAIILGASSASNGQPGGKAPPIVQFKQFGSTPEQFFQSSVYRWTTQLTLDLETMKTEIATAKLAPVVRAAINTQIENAILQTLELDQVIRKGGAREKANAAFADVERALAALAATINQNPVAKQATAVTAARADNAYHQLAAVFGAGDNNPQNVKRRLIRLSEGIDDNTEDLRLLIADTIGGNDRQLDRALALYSREARYLGRLVRDDADANAIKQDYTEMGQRWAEVLGIIGRLRAVPGAVSAQVARVDTLHRRLGTVLNLPPFPGGPGVVLPPVAPIKQFSFAVGAEAGAQPRVTVFADEKGTVAYNFFAYDKAFDGGVRVDMADLNGDRVPDLIVAPGPSKGLVTHPVRVYDGRDLNLLVEFVPFANWRGGVYVAGTDLTRDGRSVIAVTAEGTQHIKVFDLAQGKETDSFFAHDQKVTGGVRIAWGDANGDGVPDLFATNGPSTNAVTTVKIFNGKNRDVIAEFPAVDNKYRGGAFITAGDVTGNGQANAIVGLDAGTIPVVRVYDLKGKTLVEWLAYDERFKGGVRVGMTMRNHVVTGPGFGHKNSPARIFDTGRVKVPVAEIVPFVGFDGGLNVGGR